MYALKYSVYSSILTCSCAWFTAALDWTARMTGHGATVFMSAMKIIDEDRLVNQGRNQRKKREEAKGARRKFCSLIIYKWRILTYCCARVNCMPTACKHCVCRTWNFCLWVREYLPIYYSRKATDILWCPERSQTWSTSSEEGSRSWLMWPTANESNLSLCLGGQSPEAYGSRRVCLSVCVCVCVCVCLSRAFLCNG